jgi:hypothetical protein
VQIKKSFSRADKCDPKGCTFRKSDIFVYTNLKKKSEMKKNLLIIAVAGLAMASCKKDFTCECTTTDNGTVVATATGTIHTTKKKANDACNQTATSSVGGSTAKTECKIK